MGPVLLLAAVLWLGWPLLRPRLWPARGRSWLVVLDGYHRLDLALAVQRQRRLPILLISCPATGQPTRAQWRRARGPLLVLRAGFDTATQVAALARWHPPGDPSQTPDDRSAARQEAPGRMWLISDASHLRRARLAAQIAVGSAGTQVLALAAAPPGETGPRWNPAPSDSPPDWPVWRDALRLQLWRLSGSSGAFLRPSLLHHKRRICWRASPP